MGLLLSFSFSSSFPFLSSPFLPLSFSPLFLSCSLVAGHGKLCFHAWTRCFRSFSSCFFFFRNMSLCGTLKFMIFFLLNPSQSSFHGAHVRGSFFSFCTNMPPFCIFTNMSYLCETLELMVFFFFSQIHHNLLSMMLMLVFFSQTYPTCEWLPRCLS